MQEGNEIGIELPTRIVAQEPTPCRGRIVTVFVGDLCR